MITFTQTYHKSSNNFERYKNMHIEHYITIEDFLDINDFDKNLKNNIQFVFSSDED